MKPRRPPLPAIVLLVLALAAGGWWWWTNTQPAPVNQAFSGVVESRQYQVASVLAAAVAEVSVHEGDAVAAGQPLVRLDSTSLQLQVDQANAGVDAAQAALTQAQDDGENDATIAAARAKLKQAQAQVDLAKVQLGYATVLAPHAGTVITLTTNAGQNAAPGKTLLTLTDPADTYLRVFVPEAEMDGMKLGRRAHVTTDAGRVFDGTVTYVASDAEFTPNNVETKDQRGKLVYEVRVSVADSQGILKPGLPADVAFS